MHIVTWDGQTKNLTKLQGEGRMLRKSLTPKSNRVTLYVFARRLVSSERWFLKEIRRPSTDGFDICDEEFSRAAKKGQGPFIHG